MKAYKQLISILLLLICVIQQAHSTASRHQEGGAHTTAEKRPAEERDQEGGAHTTAEKRPAEERDEEEGAHTTAEKRQERDEEEGVNLDDFLKHFLTTVAKSPQLRKQELDRFLRDLKIFSEIIIVELRTLEKITCLFSESIIKLRKQELDIIYETKERRYADAEKAIDSLIRCTKVLEKEKYSKRLLEKIAIFEGLSAANAEKTTSLVITKELFADLNKLLMLISEKKEFLNKLLSLVSAIVDNLNKMAEERVTIEFETIVDNLNKMAEERVTIEFESLDLMAEDRVVDLNKRLRSISHLIDRFIEKFVKY